MPYIKGTLLVVLGKQGFEDHVYLLMSFTRLYLPGRKQRLAELETTQ